MLFSFVPPSLIYLFFFPSSNPSLSNIRKQPLQLFMFFMFEITTVHVHGFESKRHFSNLSFFLLY